MGKFAIALILFSQFLMADHGDVKVWSRSYAYDCEFFSYAQADVKIHFTHDYNPNAEVEVLLGEGGVLTTAGLPTAFSWQNYEFIKPTAEDEDGHWFELSKVLKKRNQEREITNLQFVVRVTTFLGQQIWYRGQDNRLAYYQLNLKPEPKHECLDSKKGKPKFSSAPLSVKVSL